MRLVRSLSLLTSLCVSASALLCGTAAWSQQFVAPTVRIVNRIDESNLVTLKGNTHPAANAKNDRGEVSPTLPMTDLILVLSRDAAQQAAFDTFVASQYDATSPNFHHWLTPDEVGTDFGPSETDVQTVENWLTGHGFSIAQVTKDRLSIRFSGTAAQVESAFHTQVHNLSVRGVAHIANMSDPQFPAALAPLVVGVKALHNFFPRPLHRVGSAVTRDASTGKWMRTSSAALPSPEAARSALASVPAGESKTMPARPQFGITVPASNGNPSYLVEDVGPYDFATIYNVLPLWNAAKPIDGTGQTIAIAGTSDIEVGQTGETGASGANDIATFRTFFGLPTGNPVNTPIRISGNSMPLTVCSSTVSAPLCTSSDLLENSLDVEWAGSVARNAQIVLVASYPASLTDDALYDSESYIVNNLTARIMNVSYGECELYNGTAGNVQYYDLWQTAASEGIAVFVASGDSGAASCDQGGDAGGSNLPYAAEYGLTVSGLASTPYDTAVGGTDFNWCSLTNPNCTAAPYWGTSNNSSAGQSNALGYLPEVPWNDTCTNPLALAWMQSFWSGVATVSNSEEGCDAFVLYDQSLVNQGYGSLLYLVDTVGGGGGASNCVVNSSTSTTAGTCTTAATSTGATNNPDTGAAQGSLTVVNDGWPKPSWQAGVSGIPNDKVRDIPDVSFFASDGFLTSSAYLVCASDISACSYSSKGAITFLEVGGTSVATPTMAGVMGLINEKTGADQGSPNAELYALAHGQTYSSCSAERGNGSPVTSSKCLFNDVDTGTNAMACDYSAYVTTPSPNCTVIQSGDYVGVLPGYSAGTGFDQATGLGSLNVANVVNAWSPISGGTPVTVTVSPAASTISISQSLTVSVSVASTVTGGNTPTGTVTLTAGSYTSSAGTLSAGSYSFTIPASSLGAGMDTIDVSYAPASGSGYATGDGTATVSVSGTGATFTLTPSTVAAIAPGASATSTITVAAVAGYNGTVTLTCQEEADASPTTGDGAQCSIPTTSVAMGGTITATVTTTAATTAALVYPKTNRNGGWAGAGGGAVLALLVFFGIPARRRSWRAMLGMVMLLVALGGMAACGGGGGGSTGCVTNCGTSDPGTAAGRYTFTVVATGNPSVTPAVQTTFTVVVN